MSDYNFTVADVVTEVRKLAAERPDFNYKAQPGLEPSDMGGCSYVGRDRYDPEGEGCIIGQALARLGVNHDDLVEREGNLASTAIQRLLGQVVTDVDDFDEDRWLDAVQGNQDAAHPWGIAVANADML